ncbi:32 kDa-cell wall symbiosis regulated acidic polypeptide precursor [Pisolithus marmoratus]|nr:32 kDa-cell wall symbiosis regulated acidic polypeptide precursor [Pisolithus marmoratus]
MLLMPTTMSIIGNSANGSADYGAKHPATVVPSTIIVFLPGVTEQHQEDVRNSFEFAVRAATKQVAGINYARWHRVFESVLHNIHWFNLQSESGRAIQRPVLHIIPVSDSERHLAKEALRALQNPDNEDALRLFCDQHPTSNAAREDVQRLFFGGGGRCTRSAKFQLTFCSEVDGELSASSFFIQLLHSGGATEVTIEFHKHGLNTHLYGKLRSHLKKRLEGSGESKQIPIQY